MLRIIYLSSSNAFVQLLRLLFVFVNELLKTRWIGAHQSIDNGTSFDKDKGRHSAHTIFRGSVWIVINVYFDKHNVRNGI